MSDSMPQQPDVGWMLDKKARKLVRKAWRREAQRQEAAQKRNEKLKLVDSYLEGSYTLTFKDEKEPSIGSNFAKMLWPSPPTDDKPAPLLHCGDFSQEYLAKFHDAMYHYLRAISRDTHIRGVGMYTIPGIPTDTVAHMVESLASSHKEVADFYNKRVADSNGLESSSDS